MFKMLEEALTFFKSPPMTHDKVCHQEGQDAYFAGSAAASCPYVGGKERESWIAGYFGR